MGWGGERREAGGSQLGGAWPGPLQGPEEIQLGHRLVLRGVGSAIPVVGKEGGGQLTAPRELSKASICNRDLP